MPAEAAWFMQAGARQRQSRAGACQRCRSEREWCLSELERMRAELPADAHIYLEGEITRLGAGRVVSRRRQIGCASRRASV
jgi:hypothetical protein